LSAALPAAATEDPSGASAVPVAVARVLAQRPLTADEAAADYDDLFGHVAAAVAPTDAIEWIWIKDVVDLVWEARRLRRLREALLATARVETLADMLRKFIEADGGSRAAAATEAGRLAGGWGRHETRACRRVEQLLAGHGVTIEAVTASVFARRLRQFESIERMTAAAEGRRDRVLAEIEKRRDAVAWRLREAAQTVVGDSRDDAPPSTAPSL
jgi:hypothetical protein